MSPVNHVVVAEDDPGDIFIFEQAFRRIGITSYKFVNTGQEVIEYLQAKAQFSDREKYPFPRWLLLEMELRRGSGFDVLDWLYKHQECRVIPTVAFSDSDSDKDVRRTYQLGANAYFVKPRGLQPMIDVLALVDHFWKIAMSPIVPSGYRCE